MVLNPGDTRAVMSLLPPRSTSPDGSPLVGQQFWSTPFVPHEYYLIPIYYAGQQQFPGWERLSLGFCLLGWK